MSDTSTHKDQMVEELVTAPAAAQAEESLAQSAESQSVSLQKQLNMLEAEHRRCLSKLTSQAEEIERLGLENSMLTQVQSLHAAHSWLA